MVKISIENRKAIIMDLQAGELKRAASITLECPRQVCASYGTNFWQRGLLKICIERVGHPN